MDVADWLRKLGLEQYEPAFRANEIDARVLPNLTAEDLKDLGITLVGHRRRLLDAIAALGATAPAAASLDAPASASAERRLVLLQPQLTQPSPDIHRSYARDMDKRSVLRVRFAHYSSSQRVIRTQPQRQAPAVDWNV